jgi:fructokinase
VLYHFDCLSSPLRLGVFLSLNEIQLKLRKSKGNREFSFNRNPSADMLLSYEQIKPLSLQRDILHFCSVSLIDYPIKQTHERLIDDIIASNGIISFDPNLRLSLWSDHDKLKKTVHDFIPKADILKVSDEELTFITGITDTSEAIQSLFVGRVKAVLYSRGKHGSSLYLKDKKRDYNGFKVEAIDTTGAGDAFIGAVLYQIQQMKKPVEEITLNEWDDLMRFSNGVAALTTTKKGAINSLPTLEAVVGFIK